MDTKMGREPVCDIPRDSEEPIRFDLSGIMQGESESMNEAKRGRRAACLLPLNPIASSLDIRG